MRRIESRTCGRAVGSVVVGIVMIAVGSAGAAWSDETELAVMHELVDVEIVGEATAATLRVVVMNLASAPITNVDLRLDGSDARLDGEVLQVGTVPAGGGSSVEGRLTLPEASSPDELLPVRIDYHDASGERRTVHLASAALEDL